MSYSVTVESFTTLNSIWKSGRMIDWSPVFVLPVWLEVWWQEFQPGTQLHLAAVRDANNVIGIAPLQIAEDTASFVGGTDVCDYVDFITVPGREPDFFGALVSDLKQRGVTSLELKHLRPDSVTVTKFQQWARDQGYQVDCRADDVSVEMELPASWDEYLGTLTTKQRHEVGRKLRRLGEMGKVSYRTIGAPAEVTSVMGTFLKLFAESREDKAAFLTPRMESFFRAMTAATAKAGLLKIGVLELDSTPVGMVMYFDYKNIIYLYNSGFDCQYSYVSAGLLCKVLCIKDSIEKGRKRFEFLKGDETYKFHLGGKEIKLYSCQVKM